MAESAVVPGPSVRMSRAELGRQLAELHPRLTSVARRFSVDSAEDIVQNAFEKAWRRFDQFDGRARLSTWVHRIVVNEALMLLRSERRRARHQDDLSLASDFLTQSLPDPADHLDQAMRGAQLRAGLAELSESDREVLQLCVLDEVPYPDYCARSGIGAAAAKSRAFRARQRLREVLSRDA